uniref:Uncharacterized protein n=1 Tax=Cacopsylla melanoneura TaxID=428564 RepID=A0A8D9E9F1_9HEMI
MSHSLSQPICYSSFCFETNLLCPTPSLNLSVIQHSVLKPIFDVPLPLSTYLLFIILFFHQSLFFAYVDQARRAPNSRLGKSKQSAYCLNYVMRAKTDLHTSKEAP